MRNVPDVAISSSPNHDGYLFCSEDDGSGGIVATCTSGFRTGAGGNFTIVGGTSAAAPTVAAILALLNQSLGNTPPTGLAQLIRGLYQLASSFPADFNDAKTGDNKVPCTSGTTNCPAGTTSIGYSAGTGYDQVTGLGSVNGAKLAQDLPPPDSCSPLMQRATRLHRDPAQRSLCRSPHSLVLADRSLTLAATLSRSRPALDQLCLCLARRLQASRSPRKGRPRGWSVGPIAAQRSFTRWSFRAFSESRCLDPAADAHYEDSASWA